MIRPIIRPHDRQPMHRLQNQHQGKPMPANEKNLKNEPLDTSGLTWAVLIGRWTEFARSSVALPEAGEAGLVRQSVTDIITLQAVWFALGQLEELDPNEQGIGLDRAGVLIHRHASAIRTRFEEHDIPEGLADLISDVEIQYQSRKDF